MNSPFANMFLAIQNHVQAQVSSITYIDQDLGQLLEHGSTPPSVTYPCALIDFEDFHFEDLGNNVQTAKGTVIVSLGFSSASSSAQGAPESSKEAALAFYDIEWCLNKALEGWSPGDNYGYLTRQRATTQKRYDGLRVRELRYSLYFEDYSAKTSLTYVAATENLTVDINL